MRKVLPILIALTVFLTPLYPVYAQKTATSPGQIKNDKMGEGALSLKDSISTKEAEFKKKITKFKDKTKAERVERINRNLNLVNERKTAQMQQTLEKIADVLERLKDAANKAEDAGLDLSDANTAISETETKWKEADSSLKLQMDKDYSIEVNTEKTVKEDASLARSSLKSDLKNVHTLIVGTKQSLASAISETLSSVKGGTNGTD